MRVAVIGAGALGCLFGGRLAASGHDVWLLHRRQEYVDRLRREGVHFLNGEMSPVDVAATTDAREVGTVDLALVLVKAHQTTDAVRQHRACLSPGTHVLTLQNGLRNREQLASFVDDNQLLAGVTYEGAMVEAPGHVRHTAVGGSVFGGSDRAFAGEVAEAFEGASLDARVVDDPEPTIWNKQLVSLAIKPLAALTRLPNDELLDHNELRWVMERVLEEAVAVGIGRGVDFMQDDPHAAASARLDRIRERATGHRSSMLQDIDAGRRTEIDEINGAIASLANEHDVDAPFNRLLTALVHGLEHGYGAR